MAGTDGSVVEEGHVMIDDGWGVSSESSHGREKAHLCAQRRIGVGTGQDSFAGPAYSPTPKRRGSPAPTAVLGYDGARQTS